MPQFAAVETNLEGEVLKVTLHTSAEVALKKYKVPDEEVARRIALTESYKYGGPGFGPFVAIRPISE